MNSCVRGRMCYFFLQKSVSPASHVISASRGAQPAKTFFIKLQFKSNARPASVILDFKGFYVFSVGYQSAEENVGIVSANHEYLTFTHLHSHIVSTFLKRGSI